MSQYIYALIRMVMHVYAIVIISRVCTKKGRYRISEIQSSTNHNLVIQAALQPRHKNMESPSIDSLLLDFHDEHHDIAIDGESN